MKLHLGCGKLKLPDFINIDIISDKADIKLDLTDLSIINSNVVEEIYICHTLEHITRNNVIDLLLSWNRILVDNGILRIAVPDFEKIVKVYFQNKNMSELIGLLNGGQKDKYDIHGLTFDFITLKELLESCGFANITRYNAEDFLDDLDDFSKCYLPHMDKKNGELMSLNIFCNKVKHVDKKNVQLSEKLTKYTKYKPINKSQDIL